MPISESRKKAIAKWDAEHTERITVKLNTDTDGTKADIQAAAERAGQSVNAYIRQAIRERMNTHVSLKSVAELRQGVSECNSITEEPNEQQSGIISAGVAKLAADYAEENEEPVKDFIQRAIETQIKRDRLTRSLTAMTKEDKI